MTWKTSTHQLAHTVEHEGKTFTHVSLKEPNVEALEAIDDLEIADGKPMTVRQVRGVITALADAPPAVIGKLHRKDFAALGAFLDPLLLGDTTEADSTV